MKARQMILLFITISAMLGSASAQQTSALKNEKEIRSYALGMDVGANLRKLSVDVDPAVFAKGLGDALAGGKTLMTEAEAKAAVARVQADVKAREYQERTGAGDSKKAEENKKAGDAFLAQNKAKDGVVTLPSGLQYKVLTAGTGKRPAATDTVVCHYKGMLIDGTAFDSSYARNEPATFPVRGVIPGWTEALQLMPVGSKWQVVIPPELGYGLRGAEDKIGPNATLVFEIELLAIK